MVCSDQRLIICRLKKKHPLGKISLDTKFGYSYTVHRRKYIIISAREQDHNDESYMHVHCTSDVPHCTLTTQEHHSPAMLTRQAGV